MRKSNEKRLIVRNFFKKKVYNYSLEIFINKIIIKNKLRLQVVHWDNVENNFHNNKDGFIKGWERIFKIWKDIVISAGGIIQIYKMNIELRKLLLPHSKQTIFCREKTKNTGNYEIPSQVDF